MYSTVFEKPVKTARYTEIPTIDGGSVLQLAGYLEMKSYRFDWISTEELQTKIRELEAEAVDGWVIAGDVARTPIHQALDLYSCTIRMKRNSET